MNKSLYRRGAKSQVVMRSRSASELPKALRVLSVAPCAHEPLYAMRVLLARTMAGLSRGGGPSNAAGAVRYGDQ